MCFQDFPMSEETDFYPHHTKIMEYLNHVVATERLDSLIHYRTIVENAEYDGNVWKVTVHDVQKDVHYTEEYDAIVIATGHYTVPFVPDIPGLREQSKKGHSQFVHSRDYRNADPYKDKVFYK